MGQEIKVWKVGSDKTLSEVPRGMLSEEKRLEVWLEQDISILDPGLLVVARQQPTHTGGIDLLCINRDGDLVIIELKRDKTPREVTAQALDYASWVVSLEATDVLDIANKYLQRMGQSDLKSVFQQKFHIPLPEEINTRHRMLVVGSSIDDRSERIIRYLSEVHNVDINAATFSFHRDASGAEYLARVFLLEPTEVEARVEKKGGKRLPNLTREELLKMADANGVLSVYQLIVDAAEQHLQAGTTQNSIAFSANLSDGKRTIFSLWPGRSSSEKGLRFELYVPRAGEALGISEAEVESILPSNREAWRYYEGAPPDLHGFAGFFETQEEAARFAGAIEGALGEQTSADS